MLAQTFQAPNEYVDYYCRNLTGAEFKILMVATRKICGFADHRQTMRDRISISQFQEFSGIKDRQTVIDACVKLGNLGILKKVGKPTQAGQDWKLVRHLPKPGQQDFFDSTPVQRLEKPTKVVGKAYQGSRKIQSTKPIPKPISNSLTNVRTESTMLEPNQNQKPEPTTNDEIVKHLREMAASGNGVSAVASQTLLVLEQLWNWNAHSEVVNSWKWFFMCAQKWPRQLDVAFGMTRERMQRVDQAPLRAPGAYMTKLIKNAVGTA